MLAAASVRAITALIGDLRGLGYFGAMQLGMIGLGRMGANMVRRAMRGGHQCVVYDRDSGAVNGLAKEGATGTTSLDQFAAKLAPPRTVWIMVPADAVDGVLKDLAPR